MRVMKIKYINLKLLCHHICVKEFVLFTRYYDYVYMNYSFLYRIKYDYPYFYNNPKVKYFICG